MRGNKMRMMGMVLGVAMLVLSVASSAVAAPAKTVTARNIVATDASMSISVMSTGDAGLTHGNANPWTSPVDAVDSFYWFNKAVQITAFDFADRGNGSPTFSGATFGLNIGSGYASQTVLAEPYSLSDDGVYSIVASATDTSGTVSDEITPAFGIDQTDPEVTTDRVPFYAGIATVTVTATDTMSGIENVFFNVDGARNDVWEPDFSNPSSFSVSFPFIGTGVHVFSWVAFDNAGNALRGSETFSIDNVAPTTTSDLQSSYNGAATIHLTATDNDGGSGVAHTYYSLDGATAVDAAALVVPAPANGFATHTVDFWSVDAVGNVEATNTGEFTVNSLHTITPSRSNSHGTISPSTRQTVAYGGSKKFTMKAKTNYKISKVTVDGRSIGAKKTYTFKNVNANHTIRAYFVHK
jgi:hypothetical protein